MSKVENGTVTNMIRSKWEIKHYKNNLFYIAQENGLVVNMRNGLLYASIDSEGLSDDMERLCEVFKLMNDFSLDKFKEMFK